MATLTWVDSFDHQVASTVTYTSKAFYDQIGRAPGVTFDTTNQRTGAACLQIVQDGVTATFISKTVSTNMIVVSFYVRIATNPGNKSQFFHTLGATVNALVGVDTNGIVFANIGGAGEQDGVADISDGNWHRIDIRYDTSGATHALDVEVDGTALTQVTSAQAGGSTITAYRIGSNTAAHTMTFQADDLVVSQTSGDFPIGDHRVELKVPNDDSADSVYGTNVMEQGDGTDLSGSNEGYQYLNEWPPTTGTNNADTVTQAANGTGNFVEVEFEDVSLGAGESLLGVVMGRAAIQSDGTSSNNGTTRFVDGSNATLLDLYSGDQSDTALRYLAQLIPAPGGTWDTTEVNAIACRVGLSSDANPDPEWAALAIEVPIAEGDGGVTGDGTGTIQLSAAAAGVVLVQGDGTGTIRLSGAADGSVLVSSDGTGTIRLSAAGDGSVADPALTGDGTGTIQLSAAGDGSVLIQGTSTPGPIRLSAAGDGSVLIQGVSTPGPIRLSAAADGSVLVQGDGAGTIQLAAAAAGVVLVQGDGTGTIQFTAAGTGDATSGVEAEGAASIALSAAGVGSVAISGDGALALALVIAAEAVVTNPNVSGFVVARGQMSVPRVGKNRRRRM